MKLAWFQPMKDSRPRLGAVIGNEMFDLPEAQAFCATFEASRRETRKLPATIKEVLSAGRLDDVHTLVRHISDNVQRYRSAKLARVLLGAPFMVGGRERGRSSP